MRVNAEQGESEEVVAGALTRGGTGPNSGDNYGDKNWGVGVGNGAGWREIYRPC